MICKNCGANDEDAMVCPNCGADFEIEFESCDGECECCDADTEE